MDTGSSVARVGGIGRRELLKSAIAGVLCLVVAQAAAGGRGAVQIRPNAGLPVNDLELLGHLRTYLASKLGGPVELVSRRTYQEITALLVSGQIQSAWICGYPYVQYKADLDLVATPVWHGKPLYQSYLIAAADGRSTTGPV